MNGSLDLTKAAHEEYDFTQSSFPQDLTARGVDKWDVLAHYPYRDDGQLLWDAIGNYTKAFVSTVYPTSDVLTGDVQLDQWWGALVHETGLKGFPVERTAANLAFMLQSMIFRAGPYHSAVNYPQVRCLLHLLYSG